MEQQVNISSQLKFQPYSCNSCRDNILELEIFVLISTEKTEDVILEYLWTSNKDVKNLTNCLGQRCQKSLPGTSNNERNM